MLKFFFPPPAIVRFFAFGAILVAGAQETTKAEPQPVQIQFVDSVTGYSCQPDAVTVRSAKGDSEEKVFDRAGPNFAKSSKVSMHLEQGRHTVTCFMPGYRVMAGEVEVSDQVLVHRFLLDPVVLPTEVQPDHVASLQREDATLIYGYVVADDSGQPLAGARIFSMPSGAETRSDVRGFFQLHVPVQSAVDVQANPATFVVELPGFESEDHLFLEIWPNGMWHYNLRLTAGEGRRIVDERALRRSDAPGSPVQGESDPANGIRVQVDSIQFDGGTPKSTSPTNSTVRVPRNIRVLQTNGVTVDYISLDNYARHVLPAEWIASWATITGGSNSLNAGAVAIRCYAIARINSATNGSWFDICGTTACQAYRPLLSSPFSDTAVNYTANYVLLSSGGSIASTEYSAEDNSLGFSCGDGFTQPTGGCTYDPVCAGETRAGHGRGMCQWGSAKWATGRKFVGNITSNTTTNGYPRRDWMWILQHYYPTLTLIKGSPLIVGDDIRALTTLSVRACPDGSISNGIYCNIVTTKAAGSTGVIISGPQQITADASGTNGPGGFTWYQIQWSDLTIGWAQENYLERVFGLPTTPGSLTAAGAATNQINLSWSDTSGGVAAGFKLERAISNSGPWTQITNVPVAVLTYADRNLPTASTWFYRIRAYNAGGNSSYSGTVNATTFNMTPFLSPIANKTISEGTTLVFTNTSMAPDLIRLLADFEPFPTEGSNGIVMFRTPRFSGSTSALLDATPDLSVATDLFPGSGSNNSRVLRVNCNFTNAVNPWMRLTTSNTGLIPNPVIDFSKQLRFNIYSDKSIQVAIGCREATVAAGTAIGSDGGTTGGIEWVGVTNSSGGAPLATRGITASNWTTVTIDFSNEPVRNFTSGNGVLSTTSGLGTLEHIAVVPMAGTGIYNVYLDNFAVVVPRILTYGLAPGAPVGATVNPTTGAFAWTPGEGQGPSSNSIGIIVADNGAPPLSVTNFFTVMVTESNTPPVLASISDRTIHAGTFVGFTNSASDADLPANNLAYSLLPGAPSGANIGAISAIFAWQTSDSDANTTNTITVRAFDDGTPVGNDEKSFTVTVLARPGIQSVALTNGMATLTWESIAGKTYRVQYKNQLNDLDWNDLSPDVPAAGSTASFEDPAATSAQRFYRIQVISQ